MVGSLKVAIVTIALFYAQQRGRASCDQTSNHCRVQDLACESISSCCCSVLLSRREPLVEHQIHQHACDRDVQPDWHRPARDPLMSIPSTPKNLNKRHDDQRQRHKGKQNVRSQHRKINGSDPACISGRFFTDPCVVRDVADQKTAR